MNTLQLYIQQNQITEKLVMDALQGQGGIISDNCVNAADVAESSCDAAIHWLHKNYFGH